MKDLLTEIKSPATRTQANPLLWLKSLSESLERTQCKKNGETLTLTDGLEALIRELERVRADNKRLWWVGNGGSNALCSHLSQDALNKLKIKSMNFSDPSLITCMANDFGYPNVYARPLSTLAESGDLLIAVSSSGNSQNIIECVKLANERGMRVVTVSGFSQTNTLYNSESNLSFYLPASLYGITEVGHEALLHSAIESLWMREQAAAKDTKSKVDN